MFASMMKKSAESSKPVVTGDGTHTLYSTRFGEHYHSSFGAVQESEHIFIEAALAPVAEKTITINLFEAGFGTGLNALLAYRFAENRRININYVAVEAYPVTMEVVKQLNYPVLTDVNPELFWKMHGIKNRNIEVSSRFNLTVYESTLQDYRFNDGFFDVVFFDAFSPESQPEMWRQSCFDRIYAGMKTGGVLTTYSSKGIVKRALKAAGFSIEKLPGPPGKREFIRAVK